MSRMEKQKARLAELKAGEDALRRRGFQFIAGVDEAGRGPLAGPVVAAAVVLPENFDVLGIDDSKKLSEKKREALYEIIMERAAACGVGIVDETVIDEINILQATKLAMKQALEALAQQPDYILFDAMKLEDIHTPQESVIKGDARHLSIAAASIIAKVTRDRMMAAYAEQYPGYGFERNKGYGTKAHYESLRTLGMCPIHRRTFLKNL